MPLPKDFPTSPYEILDPNQRWTPDQKTLDEDYKLIPPLVHKIRLAVNEWRKNDYDGASDTSKALLKYWFDTKHIISKNDGSLFEFRYYFAQRESVETIIYLHEIAKIEDKHDILRFDSSDTVRESMIDETWARFVIKMATGSGKTKVLSLILAWSYFHKLYEKDSTLSRNFLVITPNIIVLDRIRSDFDGLKIFFQDPILPENGFEGRNWEDDFQLTLHIQDNVSFTRKTGNIFLTNIHRVYDSHNKAASANDENTMGYFLGEKAVASTMDSKVDLGEIVRNVDELLVLNDEAHHIHEKRLAWFKSIDDIHNRLVQKGKRLSMQVDFTATPKKVNGAIFPQTIVDYPLVEAIHQNIVKRPILPDKESRKKLKEIQSIKVEEKYRDHIDLGYHEWKKAYKEHIKVNKKAVMFLMVEDTKKCDEVGIYLEKTYPDFKNSVLVIHTKANGELSETGSKKKLQELDELRKAANEIDSMDNKYNAIVSVLVLKEGWDVKNVTTIVGLRSFSSKAKILPEQTLGRGLRRMYPGIKDEKVSIIGTDAFLEFVEKIKVEGVELDVKPMGEDKESYKPLVVEVDIRNPNKDINLLNIEIPLLSPKMYRRYDQLENMDVSKFENKRFSIIDFDKEQLKEIVFIDIVSNEVDHILKINEDNVDFRSMIAYFAHTIVEDLKLKSGYHLIYEKVKDFIMNYLFKDKVDLEDPNIIKNIARLEVSKAIIETFRHQINLITVQNMPMSAILDKISIKNTRPFITRQRDYIDPYKSVFNIIIGDSGFELEFAEYLDKCHDITSFTKNYLAINFKIDYQNTNGELSNYYPDFLVKKSENEVYIIETKGLEDLNVPLKLNRLKQWCEDVNSHQMDVKYNYLYIKEATFAKYRPKNFEELIKAFKDEGEGLIKDINIDKPEQKLI